MVGLSLVALLRRFPLGRRHLVDVDPAKAEVAAAIGVPLVAPEAAAGDCDLVFEASASAAGVAAALRLCGDEGEVIELSWFGDRQPALPLGADFHARRLTLRASQVSRVSPARAARRTTSDRLKLALEMLRDKDFDALLAPPAPFAALPETLRELDAGRGTSLCQLIAYPQEDACTN